MERKRNLVLSVVRRTEAVLCNSIMLAAPPLTLPTKVAAYYDLLEQRHYCLILFPISFHQFIEHHLWLLLLLFLAFSRMAYKESCFHLIRRVVYT